MATSFTGKIFFANGVPAAGVQVRVFDRDEGEKGDDDLTVAVGISDSQGKFTLQYEPSRYLDYQTLNVKQQGRFPWDWRLLTRQEQVADSTDIYLPYLEFRYTYKGRLQKHQETLVPFANEFRLPELYTPELPFVPSQHGFQFLNRFPGYPLPFSVPSIPGLSNVEAVYGLCGGMSSAAYDFFLAGETLPKGPEPPAKGSSLHQYLYRRQMDTFGAFGLHIAKFAKWMLLPEETIFGTYKRTYDQFEEIRAELDDGNLAVLGLVYVSGGSSLQIWENHQVLAYGYTEVDGHKLRIDIYDPNYPGKDDVYIEAERVTVGQKWLPGIKKRVKTVLGLRCRQRRAGSNLDKQVRGFFQMPYVPVSPLV